jgi:hypothetical protein
MAGASPEAVHEQSVGSGVEVAPSSIGVPKTLLSETPKERDHVRTPDPFEHLRGSRIEGRFVQQSTSAIAYEVCLGDGRHSARTFAHGTPTASVEATKVTGRWMPRPHESCFEIE